MEDVTFGVCDLTLPARARDPWTFPMASKGGSGGCSERKEDGLGLRVDVKQNICDDSRLFGYL